MTLPARAAIGYMPAMRRFLLLLLALAVPAGAQQIGARSAETVDLMAAGVIGDDADTARAVAAAAAFPLGSRENPVRVGGPEGERAYIARLRCADGSAPKVGGRGSAGVGAFGTVVDMYPLDCGAAAPGRIMLVMDMYHEEHREDRAPPGFTIAPR